MGLFDLVREEQEAKMKEYEIEDAVAAHIFGEN